MADYYGTFSDRQGEEFEAAQKAVEASPLSGNAQMALALAYGKAGRYEDALKCCLKRDKLIDNRWLGSNFYVEVVKLLNGDYEAAIRNLIALACGTSDSYERKESIEFLSTAELEEGEFYPNANQRIDRRRFNVLVDLLLKDAIVSNPGVLAYQYLLGAMYEGREQYAQAAAAYGKAVDAYGAEAAYKQFDCLMKLRDYSSALATLNSYSSAHSDDPEFYEKRAMLRELVGEDKDSILADYDRIVELCGSLAYERKKAFEKRAGFERRNGMTEEAILDYTAALYEKSSHQDYMLRGFLFLSLGDSALAEEDFRMVDYYAKTSTYAFSAFGLGKEYAVSQMKTYVDECKLGNYNYDDYYDDDDSDEEEDTEADARYYLACLYSLNGECDLSIKELKAAIRNGYDNLVNIKKEPFLDKARQDPAFNDVLKYYDELHAPVSPAMSPAPSLKTVENNEFVLEVHFSKKGGVLEVPCVVNGLPLSFIFDSGASDVSLSPVEAKFMINNGYVAKSDIGDKAYYRNADGSLSKSTRLLLKSVMFGGETLSNVWASVSEGQSAPLLLGQSALSRLGKVEIDYDKEVIRIRCNWWR